MKTIEEISDIIELQTWATQKPATLSALLEHLESVLEEGQGPENELASHKWKASVGCAGAG